MSAAYEPRRDLDKSTIIHVLRRAYVSGGVTLPDGSKSHFPPDPTALCGRSATALGEYTEDLIAVEPTCDRCKDLDPCQPRNQTCDE